MKNGNVWTRKKTTFLESCLPHLKKEKKKKTGIELLPVDFFSQIKVGVNIRVKVIFHRKVKVKFEVDVNCRVMCAKRIHRMVWNHQCETVSFALIAFWSGLGVFFSQTVDYITEQCSVMVGVSFGEGGECLTIHSPPPFFFFFFSED